RDRGGREPGASDPEQGAEDDQADHERQQRVQDGREDHDVTWHRHLGDDRAAGEQRRDAVRGALGEEVPQHDTEEEEAGIVGHVEADEDGEDQEVDDREDQRVEHRPGVAQDRVGVADLEVLEGELDGELPASGAHAWGRRVAGEKGAYTRGRSKAATARLPGAPNVDPPGALAAARRASACSTRSVVVTARAWPKAEYRPSVPAWSGKAATRS